jgi:hypothetical protein
MNARPRAKPIRARYTGRAPPKLTTASSALRKRHMRKLRARALRQQRAVTRSDANNEAGDRLPFPLAVLPPVASNTRPA